MATRPLQGVETAWATPKIGTSVQLAIKFNDEKVIPKVVSNMQKMFYATRLKVINGCFHQLKIDSKDVPIIKMPNYIQNCQSACQWIFDKHAVDITKSLCKIACNDNMVVVNTNHSVHDAGYAHRALQHCLDNSLPKMPVLSIPTHEAYKPEIEALLKREGPNLKFNKLLPGIPNDLNSKYLVPRGECEWSYDTWEAPMANIACFDHVSKKPVGLTEFMWTGMGIAI